MGVVTYVDVHCWAHPQNPGDAHPNWPQRVGQNSNAD